MARPIEWNANYTALVGHRLPPEFLERFNQSKSEDRAAIAVDYTVKAVSGAKPVAYIIPETKFLFCGKTNNNIREFNWIKFVSADLDWSSSYNLFDCEAKKNAKIAGYLDQFSLFVSGSLAEFYVGRSSISAALVFQVAEFVINLARFLFSLEQARPFLPRLAVVANDHAPTHVAFSIACREAGIKRMYIQHAEVSSSFPPLEFDISILRNEVSKKIYSLVGKPTGEIFVISRECSTPTPLPIKVRDEVARRVVVYPTGRILPDPLLKVFASLRENQLVDEVYVKPHPNQRDALWPEDVVILDKIPAFSHVALVANSSVVIELLHRGIPAFQNFDFDPIEVDYYGFVKNKIAGHVSLPSLSTPFWREYRFDANWVDRFRAYSPSASDSAAHIAEFTSRLASLTASPSGAKEGKRPTSSPEISIPTSTEEGRARAQAHTSLRKHLSRIPLAKRVVRRVNRLISRKTETKPRFVAVKPALEATERKTVQAGSVRIRVSREARLLQLQQAILAAADPADWLVIELKEGLDEELAMRLFERLYNDRIVFSIGLLDQLVTERELGTLSLWAAYRRQELTGVPPAVDLAQAVDTVLESNLAGYRRAQLERLLVKASMREVRNDLVKKLLSKGKTVQHDVLPVSLQISLLSFIRKTEGLEAYSKLRGEFWSSASPLHRLKILELDASVGTAGAPPAHKEIEFAFRLCANPVLSSEFMSTAKPHYDRLRPQMEYMDARFNEQQCSKLLDRICLAVEERKPLSLIRLGDGEGYAFGGEGKLFAVDDQANRERHWWGLELQPDLRGAISSEVRAAVSNADLLGIPSIHRFVRDVADKTTSFKTHIQGRGILQILNDVEPGKYAVLTEDRVNLVLFRNISNMKRVLARANKMVIVCSANSECLPMWIREKPYALIPVPTHHKTSSNEKYRALPEALPYAYKDVQSALKGAVEPGCVVLVAAGFLGKALIGTVKEAGGVGIDIGSCLDEWLEAGIHSLH